MGRPLGSKNRKTPELAALFDRLEKKRAIDPEAWVLALDRIACDEKRPAEIRITAIDRLLRFRYGNPASAITATVEAGRSWQDVLIAVVTSEQGRRNREELENWREQRRLAVTTEVQSE